MKIRDHVSEPVFVSHVDPEFVSEWLASETPGKMVELRIGEPRLDKSRHVILTPREAQRIAIALLTLAEASLPDD
jgi:hypothetical protein